MYGLPYRSALGDVDVDGPVVFVVGGAKVPAEVFELCAHNIAVGNQPHSEVAALALCLDRWNGHVDVTRDRFEGGELQILPSDGGKVVVDVDASESGIDSLHTAKDYRTQVWTTSDVDARWFGDLHPRTWPTRRLLTDGLP